MKSLAVILVVFLFAVGSVGQRLTALERNYELCCTTTHKPAGADDDLELLVLLRRHLKELETRIERLEQKEAPRDRIS